MPATMSQETYTPTEVAHNLNRHLNSIYRNLQQGDLRGYKVGGEWIITESALREWVGDEIYEIKFEE